MRSVPIPGQILRTNVFLGLTFDELVALGSIPLVVLLPGAMIEQVPLSVTVAIGGLTALGVVAVAVRTPDGQTPTEWAAAAFRRRVTPDTYYRKPRAPQREPPTYLDVLQTRPSLERADSGADSTPIQPADAEIVDLLTRADRRESHSQASDSIDRTAKAVPEVSDA